MPHKIAAAVLLAAGAAGSANAALISFASDTDPDNPTLTATFFEQTNDTLVAAFEPTFVELDIDTDGDGPGGPDSVLARLNVEMMLSYISSAEVVPGVFNHMFSLVGNFEFSGPDQDRGAAENWSIRGDIELGEAIFTGLGNELKVGSASMTGYDISYTLVDAPFLGSGEALPGDFGFTLTDMNDGEGADLTFGFDSQRGENVITGIEAFNAESSFSGRIVPTPGAVTLAGIGGLTMLRRRRSAK